LARFQKAAQKRKIEPKKAPCKDCGAGKSPDSDLTVSFIINTHNEGDDVRSTIESFRSHCNVPMEVIVVADGTTDRSCNNLGEKVRVIRNEAYVGCGKAKAEATMQATGKVLVYADGHMRVLEGCVAEMARLAMENRGVVCPGLAPLHCAPSEQPGPDHGSHNCSWGGQLHVSGAGLSVELSGSSRPDAELVEVEAVSWACWAIPRAVMEDQLCGWNEYPGRWGSQELGLTLRAWFANVPILVHRDTIVLHRYKTGKNVDKKVKYSIPRHHTRLNSWYAPAVVFEPETFEKVWKPILEQTSSLKDGALSEWDSSNVRQQRDTFLLKGKVRSDEEFFQTWCVESLPPAPMVPRSDITAVVLQYKRPKSLDKCVKSLTDNGLRHIWAWCHENAKRPRGVSNWVKSKASMGTWSRWALGTMVDTPYVLFIDDDCRITKQGLNALREYATRYPDRVLGLIGSVFDYPFDNYQRRHFYKSHKIAKPMEADYVWPKGLLLPTKILQRIYGEADLWRDMKDRLGDCTGDDLVMSVALQSLRLPPALVVPSVKSGYKEMRDESPDYALSKQPGRLKLKRSMVKHYREQYGYRPIRMVEYERKETAFDQAWSKLMEERNRVQQTRAEIEWAFEELAQRRPSHFVEIGCYEAGSLYIYAHACQPGATLVAIDTNKDGNLGRRNALLDKLDNEGYHVVLLEGKSQSPEIQQRVADEVGPIEALHIDGDHKLDAVSQDFLDYSKLMAAGGLMMLHDIAGRDSKKDVYLLWEDIQRDYPTSQRILPGSPKGSIQGIGLVFF